MKPARHEDQPGMRASPAAKVAAVATAVIAGVYIIGVIVLNLVVASHLTEQNDERLAGRLTVARQNPAALSQRVARHGAGSNAGGEAGSDIDADGAPVFLWSANARGTTIYRAQPRRARAARRPCSPSTPRATGSRSPRPWARWVRSG